MRRYGIPAVLVAALASGGVALANRQSTEHPGTEGHARVFTLFAPTVQFKLIDLGDTGFSLGDESVFSDNLLTRRNGSSVGFDGGVCTVVRVADASAQTGTLQCVVTFSLGDQQIATQGLVQLTGGHLTGTQTAAITGGTGRFAKARGVAVVQFLSDTEANVTFVIR
jgi:hypothetical protein